MKRSQQLKAQKAALRVEADKKLDAALATAAEKGTPMAAEAEAEQAGYNARIASLDGLIAQAEALEARQATEAAAAGPVLDSQAAGARPGDGVAMPASLTLIRGAAPNAPVRPRALASVGVPRVLLDPMRGFYNTADFARSVIAASRPMGAIDQRLIDGGLIAGPESFAEGQVRRSVQGAALGMDAMAAPTSYHQEIGAAEGAMVPPAISQAVWALVFNDPLLERLTIEPTDSNAVDILKDETTPWGATGIQANWRSEAVQMTPSKLDTKNSQVRLNELYAFVLSTQELLDDAPRLNDRLNVKAPMAIRWKVAEAFMFGTGAGQPLGWAAANYGGRLTVNRQGANAIVPTDIGNVFRRLLVLDGPDNSFWVANRDTITQLVTMVIGQQPVWLPPVGGEGSLQPAPGGYLLGRPVLFSEHCQTLGTAGDLQLVNPDGYYAVQRGPARMDSSIHLYFDYNIMAFRWLFRFGGQPLLSAAVAAAKGANTKSHFVILN